MEWTDDGIVLATRPYGEGKAVVSLLTEKGGRHSGLIHGRSRLGGAVEPGTLVRATWRARLSEQLGTFALEALAPSPAALLLDDALRLGLIACLCAVTDAALPEREPHKPLFDATQALLAVLETPPEVWAPAYVRWEVGLLGELGFGLDLDRCAATGVNDGLAYVSPRTGRAVSASAGEPYRERMLVLPPFLIGRGLGSLAEVLDGLALTGHFLERVVFHALHKPVPAARERLIARLTTAVIPPSPPGEGVTK
jgi:DNA repair protein RecO (recombination protein O)